MKIQAAVSRFRIPCYLTYKLFGLLAQLAEALVLGTS